MRWGPLERPGPPLDADSATIQRRCAQRTCAVCELAAEPPWINSLHVHAKAWWKRAMLAAPGWLVDLRKRRQYGAALPQDLAASTSMAASTPRSRTGVEPHASSRTPLATSPVAAYGLTTSDTRPNGSSVTPRAAASESRSSSQPNRTRTRLHP